ncbi:hypothetical protein D9D54_13420 [Escherichia coli]|nr:hypothetical protein [Escherichia coli]
MSTITKERIELFIKNPLENGLTRGEQMELARIALASLEAEAVAYMHHSGQVVTREECCDDKIFAICCKVETPLYAAPQLPQPVVAITQHFDTIALDTAKMVMCDVNRRDEFFGGDIQLLSRIQCRIDEACRAAMLQSDGPLTNEGTMQLSGNSEQIEPVSNRDELPLDYLQGHKDGLEWAAQMAEANNPQTGDWLYDDPIDLARAIRKGPDMPTVQGGNYPVTPDDVLRMDWLVSKTVDVREPMVYGSHSIFWSQTITDEDDDYHATKLREQIDAAMAAEQAAAPQQENV